MSKEVKYKIHQIIDSIEDEMVLKMVMEDVTYYASNKDVTDELNEAQLKELSEAISEVENGETIDWDDFKKEISGWKKR